MKNNLVKKILPHFIAVLIFLIVSVLFCKPVFDGNVLNQHDVLGWIAAGKLKVPVGKTYPLSEAKQAHIDLAGRGTTGKLLLIP